MGISLFATHYSPISPLLESIFRHVAAGPVIFVGQEFARHRDLDPVALRIGQPLDRHVEIDCRPPYFSASATLAMPALAQASSFSPPGAPDTPTAPITSVPARIGTPPPTPTRPGICLKGALAGSSSSFMVCSEVWLRMRAV